MVNVTLDGNLATYNGGAIYDMATSAASSLINYTTITHNSANLGGGIYNVGSTVMDNTILWQNTATQGSQFYGTAISFYSDVIQNGCSGVPNCELVLTTDPLLSGLDYHGGDTVNYIIGDNSSARDTSDDIYCPGSDQRGVARPQGTHCDIGSTEFDNTPPVVSSITRLDPSPNDSAAVHFRVLFSEDVTGVTANRFSLTTTGNLSGLAITGIENLGSDYDITVSTGTGSGTLRLDLIDDDSIKDIAGNPLGGVGSSNGSFNTGEIYVIRHHLIYIPIVIH